MTAKDFAGIRGARVVAFALLLGLLAMGSPRFSAAALTANATAQKPTSHAKVSSKKHNKSTLASSVKKASDVVKKASDTAPTNTPSTHPAVAKGKHSRKKRAARVRGQQKIDSTRALAIQQALIREHYLTGEATGKWNQASEEAMRRYQSDHGWQSKTVPDSRALISLGLGPSNDHLLNPDSAIIAGPNTPRAATLNPVSHSADPGPPASKTPTPAPASTPNPDVPRPQ